MLVDDETGKTKSCIACKQYPRLTGMLPSQNKPDAFLARWLCLFKGEGYLPPLWAFCHVPS